MPRRVLGLRQLRNFLLLLGEFFQVVPHVSSSKKDTMHCPFPRLRVDRFTRLPQGRRSPTRCLEVGPRVHVVSAGAPPATDTSIYSNAAQATPRPYVTFVFGDRAVSSTKLKQPARVEMKDNQICSSLRAWYW